ncbi:hypothetical protein [Brenneria corticis]|uniref:Uncharacterized protein n=1 Tax=Brenneria corticis TaxID=2173106 RepID=A0A2U1U483_9GAMM|nr:hypothetical protein [Brenneria sp. CFCC 11842]PWC16471.1 hypothetical protein DDT56_10395 [Brenneria sp. CFCC 11842]
MANRRHKKTPGAFFNVACRKEAIVLILTINFLSAVNRLPAVQTIDKVAIDDSKSNPVIPVGPRFHEEESS